ncbi:MAG: B12-binding domain-containing radical SAM protein [Candidatus Omnitrophica bacterium]|nr:B12-binding domain-containing radical SAM protein [Candidatus Omnitrophota bacterium]MBU1928550.1 B12-binding domain-containing radical SAM protein [Candidatus Omnitrophota bacterium]
MRICFVSPPLNVKERYARLAPFGSNMPSLGLLSLAAVVRKAGFTPAIIPSDNLNIGYNRTLERINRFSPDILAITATTFSINQAHELSVLAKKNNRGLIVLIGGHHLSALPKETLEKFPGFDIGVIGEGELTLVQLLERLEQNKDTSDTKGIVFRKNNNTVINPPQELIDRLDGLPLPAWDLLEGFPKAYYPPFFRSKGLPAASIVTSRGCPSSCIFCSKAVFGNRVRFFSPEYVFSMIRLLHDSYGVNDILIEDDTFTIDKQRVSDICELILNSGLKINWSCLARADNIDGSVLTRMKKAGCWQISFGIESGSQDILNSSQKGINLDVIDRAIRISKKSGILTKGFFILGFPNDTGRTIKETIRFAKKSALDDISVNFMTPFPGTELYNNAAEFGEFDNDWKNMNLLSVVFIPKALTREKLKKYAIIFMREFYLRPKIIYSYFKRIIIQPYYYGRAVKSFAAFLKTIFIKT